MKMLSFSACSFFILMVFTQGGDSIKCISCTWQISNPLYSSNCFNYTDLDDGMTPLIKCTSSFSDSCETELQLVDGIITRIYRRCSSGSIFEPNSPLNEKCISEYNPDGTIVDSGRCYIRCDSKDGCNEKTPENLHLCPDYCAVNADCDYSSGKCVCREGYAGENCDEPSQPKTIMSCVQCDSETDSSCFTSTIPTECLYSTQKYCAVSSISTLDKDGNTVRSFLSRSCAEEYAAADECYISNSNYIPDSQIEYTCVSTCDTDGCNTGIPDGFNAGEYEVQPIRCVVCSSIGEFTSCAYKTETDVCPFDSTHCLSTVSYYVSEKTDLPNKEVQPDFQFKSIDRACSSKAVERECTETTSVAGLSLKLVTCQETCTVDGCNTGWPARPKCSQCSCSNQCTTPSEGSCFFDPPSPTPCSLPFFDYCVIEDLNRDVKGIEKGNFNGYPRTITRRCSHYNFGNSCQATEYTNETESCYKTCQEDGCNLGFSPYSSSSTLQPGAFLIQVTLLLYAMIVS